MLRHLTRWPFQTPLKRLGVAVSGGGDSMALLDLMLWHGRAHGVEVQAVTVDHGLRPEAKDECALVARFCAEKGVSHEVIKWSWDGSGNLQAAARKARSARIADWASRNKIGTVALGHTQDDVAETLLMRLARSAGVDGLAAMERRFQRDGITWIRPLLMQSREDLRSYLRSEGLSWAEDASNSDPRFDRVKARRALPELAPLGIDAQALAGVAHNMSHARFALDHYAAAEAEHMVRQEAGDILIAKRPRQPVPSEISRRLLIAALQFVSGSEYPPRQEALVNLDVALHVEGAPAHTLHGCLVTNDTVEWMRITREPSAVTTLISPSKALWDGRWQLLGPHEPMLEIRALGEAATQCPNWRQTGLPLTSLKGSPAIWRGSDLVAAPVAGYLQKWQACLSRPRDDFARWLRRR